MLESLASAGPRRPGASLRAALSPPDPGSLLLLLPLRCTHFHSTDRQIIRQRRFACPVRSPTAYRSAGA